MSLETITDLNSPEAQEIADLLAFVRQQKAQNEQMAQRNPEPVDANIVPNPNLNRRLEYPKMVYHHGTRSTQVVRSKAEHEALGKGWQEDAFPPEDPQEREKRIQAQDSAAQDQRVESLEIRMQGIEESQGQILAMLTDIASKSKKGKTEEQK